MESNGNKRRSSIDIGCSLRTINRLIQKYIEYGQDAFVHGNRNRQPAHAFPAAKQQAIGDLYIAKYHDATFAYAAELMARHDGITISPSAPARILYKRNVISPRTTKRTKRAIKASLKTQLDNC